MKGSDATSFKTHSGDLMTCYHLTNQKISCKFFGPIGMWMLWCVASTTIRYTHFHLLIFKLKRSLQKVTKTCFKLGCVRSFHEQQKQTGSEMKGLILIRLEFVFDVICCVLNSMKINLLLCDILSLCTCTMWYLLFNTAFFLLYLRNSQDLKWIFFLCQQDCWSKNIHVLYMYFRSLYLLWTLVFALIQTLQSIRSVSINPDLCVIYTH